MDKTSKDFFAGVFVKQIYKCCEEWVRNNPDKRDDAELEYNINMLCHLTHPIHWRNKNPTQNEIDAITTLLASLIEPCFRVKAPELWERIDGAATAMAVSLMRETEDVQTNKEGDGNNDDDEETFEMRKQKRLRPVVEVEDLADGDEDEVEVVEVPDQNNREIEYLATPTKRQRQEQQEPPPSPRVLRKKIIVWVTKKA